jgi:hypothetical protein
VLEVAVLLLLVAGREVQRVVVPDADERRDVRAAVGADRRDPVELGAAEQAGDVAPRRRGASGAP